MSFFTHGDQTTHPYPIFEIGSDKVVKARYVVDMSVSAVVQLVDNELM